MGQKSWGQKSNKLPDHVLVAVDFLIAAFEPSPEVAIYSHQVDRSVFLGSTCNM